MNITGSLPRTAAFRNPLASAGVAGITTREAGNVYLAERFVPQHNATFARAPRDSASAFVPLGTVDLDPILCHEETRIVARDNTVTVAGRALQISAQPGRRSCVGLEVTVRHHMDGRITISQGARVFGTFPAVAVGWRLSDEPFMQGMGWFSDLKLRASYGVNGNQEFGDYRWVPSYAISDQFARAQFGNEFVTTIRPSAVDPALKWEETTSTNVGVDFGVLGNRVRGAVDYYVKDTDDLLFEVTVPAGSYVSNRIITNVGSVRNRGVELSLDASVLEGNGLGGLTWDANFNAATNRNRLLSINALNLQGSRLLTGGISGAVGNTIQVLQPGEAINSFLVLRHKRDASGRPVVSANDLEMYEDINGDKLINELDRVVHENPAPQWTLGHSSRFGFRNLDLSFTLRAQLGNYVYNNAASSRGNYAELLTNAGITNLHSSVLDYGFTESEYFSDVYIEDASFLRMDNLTLGYTVPRFRGLQNARVFGTVQNVFTMTGYSGLDPEAGLGGIDNTIYPRSRTFSAGVSVGF